LRYNIGLIHDSFQLVEMQLDMEELTMKFDEKTIYDKYPYLIDVLIKKGYPGLHFLSQSN
jgi:hypothetical protein